MSEPRRDWRHFDPSSVELSTDAPAFPSAKALLDRLHVEYGEDATLGCSWVMGRDFVGHFMQQCVTVAFYDRSKAPIIRGTFAGLLWTVDYFMPRDKCRLVRLHRLFTGEDGA